MKQHQINNSNQVNKAFAEASSMVKKVVEKTLEGVTKEVVSRAYRASNELRNASQYILRGQRSGKMYRVPFTKRMYRASAPGEAPAVRTGIFRLSWGTHVHVEKSGKTFKAVSAIESNIKTPDGTLLGEILEHGTKNGRIASRPYKQRIIDKAMPRIEEIYGKSFD